MSLFHIKIQFEAGHAKTSLECRNLSIYSSLAVRMNWILSADWLMTAALFLFRDNIDQSTTAFSMN